MKISDIDTVMTLTQNPAERRRYKRSAFVVGAHLTHKGVRSEVRIIDFSLLGARLQHDGHWEPRLGDACELHIELGPYVQIEMQAKVLRINGRELAVSAPVPAQLKSMT